MVYGHCSDGALLLASRGTGAVVHLHVGKFASLRNVGFGNELAPSDKITAGGVGP